MVWWLSGGRTSPDDNPIQGRALRNVPAPRSANVLGQIHLEGELPSEVEYFDDKYNAWADGSLISLGRSRATCPVRG